MSGFGNNVRSLPSASGSGFGSAPGFGPGPGARPTEPGRMVKLGVALFDSDIEMSSGWACRSGEASFRFGSVHELNNDVVWVTNLKFDEFRLQASKYSHLRRVDFLKTSLPQIAADIGIRMDGGNAEQAAGALAQIAQRAVQIAAKVYKWDEPIAFVREDTLCDDVKRSIAKAPLPKAHLKSSLLSAHQNYSSTSWSGTYEPDTVSVTMRFNRVRYARALLSNPVPDEAWTFFAPGGGCDLKIGTLLNPELPCLVEVGVEIGAIDPELAALIAFGATAGRRNGLRKWVSQPELAWLSKHATVTVMSAFVSRGARPLPDTAMLSPVFSSDDLFEHSISAGLVAECHWASLAATSYNKQTKSMEASAWSTWIRAHDRAACFALAKRAQEAGLGVNGYGNGNIVVMVSRDRLQECLAFADANEIAHPSFYPFFQQHGRTDLITYEMAA